MVRANTARTAAFLAVTDVDCILHLVLEDAVTIGRRLGRYVACCGVEILAASLTTAATRSCRPCDRWRPGATR